jgi:pimeloyl-ACP methyl ester carboxylesterase
LPYARVDDVELFYTDEGGGDPPMLFVHGYTCDSHDWSWQLAHFVASHRVIAVDLRGHGRSSAPETGYHAEQYAADVAALLDRLATGPVVAIGHSMGGLVASTLAIEYPHLVDALVTVDASYLTPDDLADGVRQLRAFTAQDPVGGARAMLAPLYTSASPPALRTWHQRRIEGMPHHVLVRALDSSTAPGSVTFRSASLPFLAQRRCPVLSVWADETRPEIERPTFVDPRSRSVAFPGSGHWLHQERPAELNEIIDTWLATLQL